MFKLSTSSVRPTSRYKATVHNMVQNRSIKSSAARRRPANSEIPHGYSVDESAGPMLRFQASLPKLPVPSLASTAAKYIETVQLHLTPSAFAKTRSAVEEFVSSDQGKELQRRLEARAAEPGVLNWLADWWNDVAYMGYRDPVVVFVSYFYVHLDDSARRDPASRAASLIKALLPIRDLVESGRLEPDKVRQTPLCMTSYKWLFNACRYPVKPSDTAHKFDPSSHNHIVFVRKNKFFEVPLFHEGKELSLRELEVQIQKVLRQAGETKGPAIGALTSENRDIWTDAREALLAAAPGNKAALERIESAIIIVCLDDTQPVSREDISWQCWVGDGRNRWYDKHQLIVFDNGRSGFLGEHSCMDGTPTLRLNESMLAYIKSGKLDGQEANERENLPQPKEIALSLDDRVQQYVTEAERHFDDLVGQHDLKVLHNDAYGKNVIKTFKISPDAWAQLVKQLAFHKMFNRPGVCYESSQTRKFQRGRTEVIRSASNESRNWVEAMLDKTPNKDIRHLAQLFRRAAARHVQYSAWASDAQGVDRHLFGLKRMLKEGEPLPNIYNDEAFAKSSHWELSTSQLSSPFIDGWGYGEVVPDGYGLSYSIGDDYIRWTITSMKKQTAELKRNLAEAAAETREMMELARELEQKDAHAKAKL